MNMVAAHICILSFVPSVESLAESPAVMTHASVPVEVRRQLGIDDTLVRLSVGIESLPDLIADLRSALSLSA
jgi:cystathionine gamma-lyase